MWYKLSYELFNSVRCCSFDWHMETPPAPQIYSSQGLPSLLPRGLERDWHHRLPRIFVIHCSRPLCLCMIYFPNLGDEIFSREFSFCLNIYTYISCVSLWLEYFNMIIIEKGFSMSRPTSLQLGISINKVFVAAVSFSKYEKLHVCQYIKENG